MHCVIQSQSTRLHHPRLPVMALLETEVGHLEDAGAYSVLTTATNKTLGDRALDLLLGTQVWMMIMAMNDDDDDKGGNEDVGDVDDVDVILRFTTILYNFRFSQGWRRFAYADVRGFLSKSGA